MGYCHQMCFRCARQNPPLYIFKGKNIVSSWLPKDPPAGWLFAANASGWTNNLHGMHWIRHFDTQTKSLLSSPDEYRLLLCDGHDSHVSAALVGYTIQHRIILVLLPPHSSHLLQPLDVGIFGPLKIALAHRQTQLFRAESGGLKRQNGLKISFQHARMHVGTGKF